MLISISDTVDGGRIEHGDDIRRRDGWRDRVRTTRE